MKSITVNTRAEIPEKYTGHVKFKDGTQSWYKDGLRHREDGPAIIWTGGTYAWYKDNILHKEDGPAVVYPNGTQRWYLNDKLFTKEAYYRELYKLGKITEQELFIELL